ncbi:hypothetical protein [Nostoc sphaeroides]|uniref:hypothetical protein n=1 Tax=Nostoc sphaeroides TaxID=446679 RepID=UPI0018840FC0|nr:hypothetical protein [Nostoc sphaeroides]
MYTTENRYILEHPASQQQHFINCLSDFKIRQTIDKEPIQGKARLLKKWADYTSYQKTIQEPELNSEFWLLNKWVVFGVKRAIA